MSSTEKARVEFERLKAEMPMLGRGFTHMKKEAADLIPDERLRAQQIEPAKFRAMIDARTRMEREEAGTQTALSHGKASLHPAWAKSNAKLQQLLLGGNHGQL